MREIPLSQGLVALIDDEDYERVSAYKWGTLKAPNTFYAIRIDTRKMIYLHRFIMDASRGVEVDHENGNGLDCRRSNMRLATHGQNQHNQRLAVHNASGYKGVSWDKVNRKWCAKIQVDGRTINLGRFVNIEDAANAYDRAAIKYHDEFARTNEMIRSESVAA